MALTTNTKTLLAARLSGSTTGMFYVAIGTGTPGASALGAELSRREARSQVAASGVITVTREWNIEDRVSGTITEAAIFDSATGSMVAAAAITSVAKGTNDTLTIIWQLTL